MKIIILGAILNSLFFLAQGAYATSCIYNEAKSTDTSKPAENYKLWALQKICFDTLLEPTKISTQDDQLQMVFYKPISRKLIVLPTGARQLKIVAVDQLNPISEIKINFNLDLNGTPLAILCKTSDDFELISSL